MIRELLVTFFQSWIISTEIQGLKLWLCPRKQISLIHYRHGCSWHTNHGGAGERSSWRQSCWKRRHCGRRSQRAAEAPSAGSWDDMNGKVQSKLVTGCGWQIEVPYRWWQGWQGVDMQRSKSARPWLTAGAPRLGFYNIQMAIASLSNQTPAVLWCADVCAGCQFHALCDHTEIGDWTNVF